MDRQGLLSLAEGQVVEGARGQVGQVGRWEGWARGQVGRGCRGLVVTQGLVTPAVGQQLEPRGPVARQGLLAPVEGQVVVGARGGEGQVAGAGGLVGQGEGASGGEGQVGAGGQGARARCGARGGEGPGFRVPGGREGTGEG